jgi:dinuclear metal center YbgI/SA1388 family protein
MKINAITSFLNQLVPPAYQESYDNCGLLVGNPDAPLRGILVSLDVTEEVLEEAIKSNCNLIIAHHPLIFKGIKKLTGSHFVERTIIKAIQNDLNIFAIHTNLDNVNFGVNLKIAQKIGLQDIQVLAPKSHLLKKLTVFVPKESTEILAEALHKAGAGNIGNYQSCSFRTEGIGTFMPNKSANPYVGSAFVLENVIENRLEVVFPSPIQQAVLEAMREAHPYEEIAYYLSVLENNFQEIGSGAVGYLPNPIETEIFIKQLKEIFYLKVVKHTSIVKKTISKVALCGGSGSFLLPNAVKQGADIYISADFKYHEYFEADNKIIIADIGHYESEQFTKELLKDIILEKFTNIAVLFSNTNTNPVYYS